MLCIILREKMCDYIEGTLKSDLDSIVQEHIKHCQSCGKLYESELKITTMFKKAFYFNNINFLSCRDDVIKNINPERYKGDFINDLRLKLRK